MNTNSVVNMVDSLYSLNKNLIVGLKFEEFFIFGIFLIEIGDRFPQNTVSIKVNLSMCQYSIEQT